MPSCNIVWKSSFRFFTQAWLEHLAWRTLSDTHRALHNESHYLLITTCSGWRDSTYTYPISQGVLATGIASKSHDIVKKGSIICSVKLACTAWKTESVYLWNNFRIIRVVLNSLKLLNVSICIVTHLYLLWIYMCSEACCCCTIIKSHM